MRFAPPDDPSALMSENRYLVTARKYRPQTFGELVSQEHVSGTLRNAIRLDRLAHAYLFSGPRGVGKTTAARILAKAINCQTPLEERDGGEPCRSCESCKTFEEGRSMNIIEIDAASNRRVEDVRELLDRVRVPPQGAKKKVYVVDEVHMFTNESFNTLLKTLEEPPPFILFIFATTEPHKVLPTILSRCQRFDFRRISVEETLGRLRYICESENIQADEASLVLIARKGDGALRDALSVFDQAVSLCGTTLTYDALSEALGVVSVDLFFQVTDRVKSRDRAGLLAVVQTLVERGYDFQEFIAGLAEHLRHLLVAQTTGSTELIEVDQTTRTRYADRAQEFSESDLLRLLMMVDQAETLVRNSPQPRLKLEMTLLKMSHVERSADLESLLRMLGSGPASSDPPEGGSSKPRSAASGTGGGVEGARQKATSADASPTAVAADQASPIKPASESTPASGHGPVAMERPAANVLGTPALQRRPEARRPAASPPQDDPAGPDHYAGSGALAPAPASKPDPHFGTSIQSIRDSWAEFQMNVTNDRIHVGAMLQHAEPAAVDRGILQVSVPDEFHRRLLVNQQDYLEQHLADVITEQEPPRLRFVINRELTDEKTLADDGDFDPFEHLKSLRQDNPIIRAIFDQFGGEPVW